MRQSSVLPLYVKKVAIPLTGRMNTSALVKVVAPPRMGTSQYNTAEATLPPTIKNRARDTKRLGALC